MDAQSLDMQAVRARIDLDLEHIERSRQLRQWEPWKVVITAATAGGALVGATVALMTILLRH